MHKPSWILFFLTIRHFEMSVIASFRDDAIASPNLFNFVVPLTSGPTLIATPLQCIGWASNRFQTDSHWNQIEATTSLVSQGLARKYLKIEQKPFSRSE